MNLSIIILKTVGVVAVGSGAVLGCVILASAYWLIRFDGDWNRLCEFYRLMLLANLFKLHGKLLHLASDACLMAARLLELYGVLLEKRDQLFIFLRVHKSNAATQPNV